ncbi:MAG: insulinase family protein [Defluviitaleaceae bacterium]|nr:insulinase family protein [Defluviitaleaceae bacterium]
MKYTTIKVIPDDKFKTATICLMLRRPLERKEATQNALLANILGTGSHKYPSLYEINKYMEELYGAVFGSLIVKKGEFQIIRLYLEFAAVMDDKLLKQAVEFLREILFNPLVKNGEFSREIFENERNMLKDSISERINNKNSYVRLKCIENMCKNEPFGIYADGYAEDLDKLDPKSLYLHYKDIIRTTPIEFVASGNIDGEKFKKLVEENFESGDLEPVNLMANPVIYNPKEPALHEEALKVNQSKICMGLRGGCSYSGKSFYEFLVFNEILGGSGNSKLFMNLREKASLCYDVFSFLYRAKSILMIQSGVETKNIDLAITKINEQLQAIKDSQISDDELHLAKQSLLAGFKSITDSQGGVLDFNYTQYILGDSDGIDNILKGISSVSIPDVVKLANLLYTDTIYILKGESDE